MTFNFTVWIRSSWLYLLFLLGVFAWGKWGVNVNPWKNWEDASIVLTLILTLIVYGTGFWGPTKFKKVELSKIGLFVGAFFIVFVMCAALVINTAHQHYPQKIPFELSRCWIILIFLIVSILLSYIDYQIGKKEDISMMKLFYYSDLPIIATILVLFIYSLIIKEDSVMDPFFSGAIAFQMIISIFLASFFTNEDIIKIEKGTR